MAVGKNFDPNDLDSFDPESYIPCLHEPGQLGDGETREMLCDRPVIGRYVTVYVYYSNVTAAEVLTICELEIFGENFTGKFTDNCE